MADAPDAFELTAAQARVLGALLEKQLTTPDAYPMTLNALTTACNQTSNRDPVVHYEPTQVETTLLALKAKGLARVIHPGSGERATKFRHVLDEAIDLDAPDRALVCVLLLRGAQTLAELKTRTERMHPFDAPDDVEDALDRLAGRDPALVARVDRAPGQREGRWIQLLEAGAERRAAVTSPVTITPTTRVTTGPVELEQRVAALELRLATLIESLGDLVELPEATTDRGM
jgi:uncharacterized protein YceH (UPF0502 family)